MYVFQGLAAAADDKSCLIWDSSIPSKVIQLVCPLFNGAPRGKYFNIMKQCQMRDNLLSFSITI